MGLGQFGKAFAPLFKAHPLVDRIALCDREPERIEKFLPTLDEMVTEGMITLEKVHIIAYRHGKKPDEQQDDYH